MFVTRRDVPATNNVEVRSLRPSVIFRKVTTGGRSARVIGPHELSCYAPLPINS